MKTRLLIIFGFVIFGFTSSTFAQDLPPCRSDRDACQNPPICENTIWDCPDNSDIFSTVIKFEDISDGSIDWDPDLSPSYAPNFVRSGFVLVLIPLGIILPILIIPHLILKKKKIPSRPYVTLIAAAIMLYIGIPYFIQGIMTLVMLLINEHLWTVDHLSATVPHMILGFVLVGGGIFLLSKSKLIRNFMEGK